MNATSEDLESAARPERRRGPSRRGVLALAGGGLLAVGAGVHFAAPRRYLRDMLARTLPGVRIDPEGLALYEEEMFSIRLESPKDRLLTWGLGPASWVDPIAPAKISRMREEFDRKALTFFFTGSDFFAYEDPREEVIGYYGALEMCAANPFAIYEDADEPVIVAATAGQIR